MPVSVNDDVTEPSRSRLLSSDLQLFKQRQVAVLSEPPHLCKDLENGLLFKACGCSIRQLDFRYFFSRRFSCVYL